MSTKVVDCPPRLLLIEVVLISIKVADCSPRLLFFGIVPILAKVAGCLPKLLLYGVIIWTKRVYFNIIGSLTKVVKVLVGKFVVPSKLLYGPLKLSNHIIANPYEYPYFIQWGCIATRVGYMHLGWFCCIPGWLHCL